MTGQDWFEKDFYSVLGVAKDADEKSIRKAYRKLARELHPDANPGDAAAEARFKDVSEAYSVLSDAEQRKQYDAVRAMAGGGPRFAAGPGGASGAGGFEDLFSGLFGGGAGGGGRARYTTSSSPDLEDLLGGMFGGGYGTAPRGGGRPAARKGQDLRASTTLPFRQAVEGSTVTLGVGGRAVTARIPPGVHDGQKIRLRGKGSPSPDGAEPGDLIIEVHVSPHPVFTMSGKNLRLTVPVTFPEAALGATIEVPTLDGSQVKVKVPAGTPSGRTLRVKGHGVKAKDGAGDLLVTIQVAVPDRLPDDAKKAVEAFAASTAGYDPREGLRERVAHQ